MLSNSSVTIGTNLAEICADRGLRIVPKQLTLLHELTTAINNNMFSNVDRRDFVAPSILMAASGTDNEVRGTKQYVQSSHDTIMDNSIIDLSGLLANHTAFARNVVNKEVKLLKEALESGLSNYKYKEPEDFFNVTYYKPHEVFTSYLVSNTAGEYKDSTRKYFFETMSLAKVTDPEFDLGKYLLTGDEEQDAVIQSWFGGLGKERALQYVTDIVPEYTMSNDAVMDYALVNFLFYRSLTEKTDLDLGLTAIQLRTKATANRDYFANKLSIALEMYQKDIRNGRLLSTNSDMRFSYFNANPLNITVYEESFAKLAEAGASIEVVFGYIASSETNDITVQALIDAKDDYLQKWMNTRSLYLITLNNNRLTVFKQILREVFEGSLTKEVTEDEQGFLNENPQFLDETKSLGNIYIDQLHVSDIEDMDKITLELVAKIRYRFTNGYFILKEMKEILSMSETMEPLEAALYATVKYITDFLLEQMDVVKF